MPAFRIFPATYVSKNVERILGYKPFEFIATPEFWLDHLHPDEAPRILGGLPTLFDKNSHHHEYRFRCANGEYRWFRDDLMLIRSESGEPIEIIGSMLDITSEKLVEINLRHLAEERDELNKKELEISINNARMEERLLLLRDMHDGFGSSLVAARMRADSNDIEPAEMSQLLSDCLSDLHIVCDVLSGSGNSLEESFADYRYRVERRFMGSKFNIHWCYSNLASIVLGPRIILNILRVIQEAFTNAVRHSGAENIYIDAIYEDRGVLNIRISDDGSGASEGAVSGRGINNMHSRARQLGAKLTAQNQAAQGFLVSMLLEV